MHIRQETPKDYPEVYTLIKTAFQTAQHADGNEQDLVNALRADEAFLPELSLVAEKDGVLAGHILFTRGKIGEAPVLILAPLSVAPAFQKQGVGTALMEAGHTIAKSLGFTHSLVLGSEQYYPRMGYVPAAPLGVVVPAGILAENFMILPLQQTTNQVQGVVSYPKAFGL